MSRIFPNFLVPHSVQEEAFRFILDRIAHSSLNFGMRRNIQTIPYFLQFLEQPTHRSCMKKYFIAASLTRRICILSARKVSEYIAKLIVVFFGCENDCFRNPKNREHDFQCWWPQYSSPMAMLMKKWLRNSWQILISVLFCSDNMRHSFLTNAA